jgi:maleylpyruvate isomerase
MIDTGTDGAAASDGRGWDPGDASGLEASTRSLVRTVDALTDEELAAPSLLPGWSRAHVVAHLALHGFALAGVLDGAGRGQRVAMYESDDQRDDDIERLAAAGSSELRDQLLAATTAMADRLALMRAAGWDGEYSRVPGGPGWPAVTIVPTRRREVEVHHVDLGVSYTRADWAADFVVELLDAVTVDHAGDGPFRVRATDIGRDWPVGPGGAGGPTVMGSGADLGWWLTGRGDGAGLTCDAGELPRLGPWRRASATAAPTPER